MSQRQETGDVAGPTTGEPSVAIYITKHCPTCAYAYQVADAIRRDFPCIKVRMIDLGETTETIPDAVFATPTYLLNGRVWSLGNPSWQQVAETLGPL